MEASAEGAWPKDGELFVGLVGPVGVDLAVVATELENALEAVAYDSHLIHLTKVLIEIKGVEVPDAPADERLQQLMTLGNEFRGEFGTKDAMALLCLASVMRQRGEFENAGVERRAYIIRQLKRPEEVQTLRRLYGENFVVIAATQPIEERLATLAERISNSENRSVVAEDEHRASALISRDEREDGVSDGQNLRDTFSEADLFVDPTDLNNLHDEVTRFIDLLFERRVRTPTNVEHAMFQAWGAALRSGSLGRQVGACLYDDHAGTLALGTNDVPKAMGGLYGEDDDTNDHRDHKLGHDPSDKRRLAMLAEVLEELGSAGWLSAELEKDFESLASTALFGDDPILKSSRLNAVIEFVRAAHAEQSAIVDAVRRGVLVGGGLMAVTSFPCHECARLILASGLKRVSFIEPYPKSLAEDMYSDSITVGTEHPPKIPFMPFMGIAPRIYTRLFSIGRDRKDPAGNVVLTQGSDCQMRLTYNGSRLDTEQSEKAAVAALSALMPQDDESDGLDGEGV